jgi:hypothetical protein
LAKQTTFSEKIMGIGLFAVFPPLFYFLYPCIMDKQITEHQAIEEQKKRDCLQ